MLGNVKRGTAGREGSGRFADQLRAVMAERGVGVEALARATGLSPRLIAKYRAGAHEPRVQNAVKIASALQVPVETLLPNDGKEAA